jgi:hypothetical protein
MHFVWLPQSGAGVSGNRLAIISNLLRGVKKYDLLQSFESDCLKLAPQIILSKIFLLTANEFTNALMKL